MDPITLQMAPTARRIVEQVLAVKPDEQVLLVTDSERPSSITQALVSAIASVAHETVLLTMKARPRGGVEPPPIVASAMLAADAILFQTSYATFHTNAARAAMANGVRLCDMWGFDEEMMLRGGVNADYDEVRRISERLAELMRGAKRARLTTPDGTDLSMSIEGRKILTLVGVAREPGQGAALPDGEAVVSPVEGSAEGVLVNPFTIEKREIAFPREPMRVEVRGGRIAGISGGYEADFLAKVVDEVGESARNIAEFALGTNPECRLGAKMREAKKAWGTAHVGIGDNKSIGGVVDSPLHIDLIFRNPTVTVDDTVLVKDGKVVV
jgi:leucyl aminopeptidase (aminopeptidase T)